MKIKRLQRTNYFTGMLLSAEALQREQEYHLERHRRQNRYLHGWGVVSGLGVSIEAGAIVVHPGLAIDCAGNELVVESCETLALPTQPDRRYLVIAYEEVAVDPAPLLDEDEPRTSSTLESARISLSSTDPRAHHRGIGPGTPGCGEPHPVRLATIKQRGNRWRIETSRRR